MQLGVEVVTSEAAALAPQRRRRLSSFSSDYTIIAKNRDRICRRDLTVVADRNQSVKVVASEIDPNDCGEVGFSLSGGQVGSWSASAFYDGVGDDDFESWGGGG